MDYLDNTWALTEQLFASLQGEAAFYLQPYHQLRHPLIFYYGHVASLYVNKLRVAGVLDAPVDGYFEVLFETGVDEMTWDDLSQSSTQWPTLSEVISYRSRVYQVVREVIESHPGLRDGHSPILEDSPLWALAMAFEHERIHLETSSVLMRELPQPLLARPEGWVANHASVPRTDTFSPALGVEYPHNGLVDVKAATVHLGKPLDYPSFGWDNEYGTARRHVPAFSASQFKISNGEFLEFVAAGGYREQRFWSKDGWGWRQFRNVKWPTFWVSVGPANLHQYRLRTVHEVTPMPWSWPAEVNAHEAKAYCAWRAERDGEPKHSYRLVTEGEHCRIRQSCAQALTLTNPIMAHAGAEFAAEGLNLNLAHGSPSPVDAAVSLAMKTSDGQRAPPLPFGDAMGNVWEWAEDDFHPLDGFQAHPYYDDFSTPCYDGKHNMLLGGSWVSTGDEASAFARFHFRPHFFQSAGIRLVRSSMGSPSPAVRLEPGHTEPSAADWLSTRPSEAAIATTGYESDKLLNEYLMLHYGTAEDVLPFPAAPKEWLHFPQRCAQLATSWSDKLGLSTSRALDIGCAVGGSTFELGRTYDEAIGVDLTASFINTAQRMHRDQSVTYHRKDQGDLGEPCVARLSAEMSGALAAGQVDFQQADACNLPTELGSFDACLLANLLCRLPDPAACLSRLGGADGLVKPGGLAIIVSPYSWMEEHTAKSTWLGGYYTEDGERIYSDATLQSLMAANGFDLLDEEDMPLLIREHERKYQFIVSHAMIFRRNLE